MCPPVLYFLHCLLGVFFARLVPECDFRHFNSPNLTICFSPQTCYPFPTTF